MFEVGVENGFVELDRAFYELSANTGEGDNMSLPRPFRVGNRLRWTDLTREFRVIVLSEAGTGKTEEIRHVAKMLRRDGKAAFFLRLEHISNNFEDAFEIGSREGFEEWLASRDEGWLLLDSVDEARLRDPGDFGLAVRKLGRHIAVAQQRVHIVITGRTAAWRPKTDLELCTRHLRYKRSSETGSVVGDGVKEEGPGLALEFHSVDRPEARERPVFKIVALEDLDSTQIQIFAASKGVKDTKAFLDAVERADAQIFTARPQDLEELVEFWNSRGQIGSRLQLMQNSIGRRLSERDQGRADARPLSVERAREGASIAAAAATMSQESTIRVPDGAENSKGIPVAAILPGWDDNDQATLLSRPIFDEAIYGTVRFHHRCVREFLTAEWVAELLRREPSRRKIEALLFRNQYGLDVVVPTMRPILPWLALLDDKIRERIRHTAPEVLLERGDPSRLPLDTRRNILRNVCEQIATGASSRAATDFAAVQRFAKNDLVSDVKELIVEYASNDDITWFLLRMIWQGELKDALPEAKAYALSATSSKYTRIAAMRAVKAVGSADDVAHPCASFLGESAELDHEWVAELLEGLEPTIHTANWLLECLARTTAKKRHSNDELANAIAAFVERGTVDLLPQIVSGLNKLLEMPPVVERRYCEIAEKFGWLMTAAAHAAERLIGARHPASLGSDTLAILHKFSSARQYDVGHPKETESQFSTTVPAWSELNRALFWYEVEKTRELRDNKLGDRTTEFWQVSADPFWRFTEADFEYALGQITERTLPDEKHLALSLAFDLYVRGGRDRGQRDRLKSTVAADAQLAERLARYLKPSARPRPSWKQSEARWKRCREQCERQVAQNREKWRTWLRANADKLRHNDLKPGQLSDRQWYAHELTVDKNNGSDRWTSGNWRYLAEEFGEDVARGYRDGAVRFWREYRPQLRSEGAPANKTPVAVIFGLSGLQIEADETPGWPGDLNAAEVELACRYASYEINGFPDWFPALFTTHPAIVGDFLLKEIRYELSSEKTDGESHYILDDVSWSGQWAWDDLAPEIYTILESREPGSLSHLGNLLSAVSSQ